MPKTHFYLKDKNSTSPTLISLYYYVEKKRFAFSTGEKIKPAFWSFKTERVTDRYTDSERINKKLNWLEKSFLSIIDELIMEKGKATVKDVRHRLKVLTGKEKPDNTLFGFIESLIQQRKESNRIKEGSIKVYGNSFKHLKDFAEYQGMKEYDFSDINYKFFNRFTEYLTQRNFSDNYINKIISTFRMFLNEATKEGINKNLNYKNIPIPVGKETADEIYLNKSELEKLFDLDLSDHTKLERVRDLFIVGAYTGLRFSDFSRISTEHIRKIQGFPVIDIVAQKTGQNIIIPLHPYVETILEKYEGQVPKISQQRMNDYLKELGERSGFLNELVTKSMTKGGRKVVDKLPKYSLLKTHTARRSFATNAFLAGWSTLSIMAISGHTTETSFMRYIKVTNEQNAVHIAKTQYYQMNPDLAKIKEVLQLLSNKNEFDFSPSEMKLLDSIKDKIKAKRTISPLRVAK